MLIHAQPKQGTQGATNKYVYAFDSSKWKKRELQRLSYSPAERVNTDFYWQDLLAFASIVTIIIAFIVTVMALTHGAWVIGLIATSGLGAGGYGTVPGIERNRREQNFQKALAAAGKDRNRSLVLRRSGSEFSSDSPSFKALMQTDIGPLLSKLIQQQAIENSADLKKFGKANSNDAAASLFLQIKPLVDGYFVQTADVDEELRQKRTKASAEAVKKAEESLGKFAQKVADSIKDVMQIHNAGTQSLAELEQTVADSDLEMLATRLETQAGFFTPMIEG